MEEGPRVSYFINFMPASEHDGEEKPLYTEEQVLEIQKFDRINKNDYYAILTVERDADDLSIRKAYKKVKYRVYSHK